MLDEWDAFDVLDEMPPYIHTAQGRAFLFIGKNIQNKWVAGYRIERKKTNDISLFTGWGDTPEEAVFNFKELYDAYFE